MKLKLALTNGTSSPATNLNSIRDVKSLYAGQNTEEKVRLFSALDYSGFRI